MEVFDLKVDAVAFRLILESSQVWNAMSSVVHRFVMLFFHYVVIVYDIPIALLIWIA